MSLFTLYLSLAQVCWFCVFKKNPSDSLMFPIFFYSLWLIFALIFSPSFLWMLCLVCAFFSSLEFNIRLFGIFHLSWCRCLLLQTSLLELIFLHWIHFGVLCVYFHLSQANFTFPFYFLLWPFGCSGACCVSFIYFHIFQNFSVIDF